MNNILGIENALKKAGYSSDKEGYIGIDYGLGRSNVDDETGIRYGVIDRSEVLQAWCDSTEANYIYTCPYCGHELKKGMYAKKCGSCHKKIDPDRDFDMLEPVSYFIDDGEYKAECDSDGGDIFITKSPFYTKCQFCSPCAPGAGYLMNPMKNGIKAYCFGHDFFDSGKAPYRVYRVDDDSEVMP